MTEFRHEPVLLTEVVEYLRPHPGGRYVDATLGGAGHSKAILQASSPDGRLLGIDRDLEALQTARQRLAQFGERVQFAHGDFSRIGDWVAEAGLGLVDGMVADLGVSTHQLESPARGFSFLRPGPLDMRMDAEAGETLAEYLARVDARELARVIRDYGEERFAGPIARRLVAARERIHTTTDLANEVVAAMPPAARRAERIHPATRTFQALRIAVNRELESLEKFLEQVPGLLKPGGRVAVISFHSLEDRVVKHFFREQARGCTCPPSLPVCVCETQASLSVITRRPVRPSSEEVARNPRARSARLRVAQRL